MATQTYNLNVYSDLNTARQFLARRAKGFARTGEVLDTYNLLELYVRRRQIKPNRQEALLLLASMLHEEDPSFRARQCELGWCWFRHSTRPQLVALLATLTKSRNRSVRLPSKKLLSILSPKASQVPAPSPAVQDLPKRRQIAKNTSLEFSTEVERLKKMALQNGSNYAAIDALTNYPAKVMFKAFRELASTGDRWARGRIAMWAGCSSHQDAPKLARRLARDDDYKTRAHATAALGTHGKTQDLPLLRRMSRWDTEAVRRESVWAVAKFRQSEDIAFFKERAFDEAPSVRTVATMALTRLMARADLERWLNKKLERRYYYGTHIQIPLECDFALYAPWWLAKVNPRIGDETIGLELELLAPDWDKEALRPPRAVIE